jgi:hypothetical protein
MPYTDQVLTAEAVWLEQECIRFSLGLPWFRSVPLANVDFVVSLENLDIPVEALEAENQGTWIPWIEMQSQEQTEWFLQDRLELRAPIDFAGSNPVALEVTVSFRLTTPNLFTAPGEPIVVPLRVTHSYPL